MGLVPVVVDDLSSGEAANLPLGVTFYRLDITCAELARVFQRHCFESLIHCAAHVSVVGSMENPTLDLLVNVQGTQHLLKLCQEYAVPKIVFLSSGGAIYGETETPASEETPPAPQSYYGLHKYCAERLIELSGLDFAILRLANVYGPRQRGDLEGGVVAIFMERLRQREPVEIFGSGEQERDFVFVKDVVEAVLATLRYNKNDVWNIGTGCSTTINQLLSLLVQQLGEPVGVCYRPLRKGEIFRSCLDVSKIIAAGLWRPRYSLTEGLRETLGG